MKVAIIRLARSAVLCRASCLVALLMFVWDVNSAQTQTLTILCDDNDTFNPLPPQTFLIDFTNTTVRYNSSLIRYEVRATVTDQRVVWNWNTNYFNLDRYSGIMNRNVDNRYFTSWHCRPMKEQTIR
jgi:hypothetical protein